MKADESENQQKKRIATSSDCLAVFVEDALIQINFKINIRITKSNNNMSIAIVAGKTTKTELQ